jgi:transposase
MSDKSSHNTNQAFLQQILSRFGACAKCLIDQGSKFIREFQDLLNHALIDHHRTSKDHPQVDGLVERMVQTCKKGLRKICLIGNKKD